MGFDKVIGKREQIKSRKNDKDFSHLLALYLCHFCKKNDCKYRILFVF